MLCDSLGMGIFFQIKSHYATCIDTRSQSPKKATIAITGCCNFLHRPLCKAWCCAND